MSDRVTPPRAGALADRLPAAAGVMAARLRSADQPLGDFAGHEGCYKGRNVIGHDVVRQVRRGCREVGADAAETNTFGADRTGPVERGRRRRSSDCHVGVPNSHVKPPTTITAGCARLGRARYRAARL